MHSRNRLHFIALPYLVDKVDPENNHGQECTSFETEFERLGLNADFVGSEHTLDMLNVFLTMHIWNDKGSHAFSV